MSRKLASISPIILFCIANAVSNLQAAPFSAGDPKIGKVLVERSCVSCHARHMDGDSSAIYTRPNRQVKNAKQLLARIRACNADAKAGWFPEEELHAAAYLNKAFYHF